MAEATKHGLMEKALSHKKEEKKGLYARLNEMNVTAGTKQKNDIIVEKDGIFTIQENIETSGIEQDPALKELIDSVLR